MTSPTVSQAESLKAEGNALFTKKDFKGAYKKYTEALKCDDKNPILYSNRAACSLGLNRYLDASTDAIKATDIDPGYARAWGRLATASMGLGSAKRAVDAWTRALSVLPVEGLTPVEKKQRDQYDFELAAAKAKLVDMEANPKNPEGMMTIRSWEHEKLPWKRAAAIIPDLIASQTWNSSAWVIHRAYTSWEEAMDGMKQGHIRQAPPGPIYVGRTGVIESLTNALIEDCRVFHIAEPDFLSMYNRQAQFEVAITKAWSDSGSRGVMEEAPKRLKAESWDSVRPALSVTVRGWVVRAFLEDGLGDNVETAIDFYNSAIEVLEWGAERWKEVPSEDKGAIFQPTFLRGIKCLYLDAFMKAFKRSPSKYPLENLLASADNLLSELTDAPAQPHHLTDDVAFFLSFFRYPLAQAHAIRAFCLLNMAKRSRQAHGGNLSVEISGQYLHSSEEYLLAAMNYPKDDENHAWFLHCGYQAQFEGGSTPNFLLKNLKMLKQCQPDVKKIWEFTSQAVAFQEAFKADFKTGEDLQRALDNKKIELDSWVLNS